MPKKLDDMQKAIRKSLKKQFPKMSDKELDRRSWAIAQKRWKDMQKAGKASLGFDEEGRKIIAENVKVIIDGGISLVE